MQTRQELLPRAARIWEWHCRCVLTLRRYGGSGGDSQPNVEVLNKKKLIPAVYALENASISEKRAMGDIYFKRVLEADDAIRLREVIEGLGARAACEEMTEDLVSKALRAIENTSMSANGKSILREYVEVLTASAETVGE